MSSTKKIEDYLKYYLPCEFMWVEDAVPFKKGERGTIDHDSLKYWDEFKKPILRKLEDINSTELKELAEIGDEYIYKDDEEKIHVGKEYLKSAGLFASQFHYLLSKGFDLFGLCEAGLAIDKTTLK